MKKNKGQLIVEMMVAVSLLVIGLLGIFAVLSQSLGLNRVAANQYVAANLAAEGIEVVKNIIDSNFINDEPWNLGLETQGVEYTVSYDSTSLSLENENEPLRFDEEDGVYGYGGGTETQFRRVITIENSEDLTEIKVTSRVYWKDRGGIDFDIVLEDRFRNWRQ